MCETVAELTLQLFVAHLALSIARHEGKRAFSTPLAHCKAIYLMRVGVRQEYAAKFVAVRVGARQVKE